jgi:hypothetical protein
MAITAAAEKTTAAFFMGFPFTNMVVDNENRIRWLRPHGPTGTFLPNLMLMNARWFEDCSADGLQRSESNKPIIYQPLHGDFAVKGTNGANGPRSRLPTDRVGHWLNYHPSATTQPVQEMQNFPAAQFLPLSDREASAYAGEAESHQTGAATADAPVDTRAGKMAGAGRQRLLQLPRGAD